VFPHPEPRSYDQILRTWSYAWWKPVLGLVVVAVGMIIVAPLALLPVLAVGVSLEGGDFWDNFTDAVTLQTVGPSALLYLNLTLGSMILVTWLVMRVVHQMRPRWLASVVPRIRWRFLAVCLGLSVVALFAQLVVSLFLPASVNPDEGTAVNDFTVQTALLALVVLLTTPLQAAGEEYVFRGYLLQAFGALLRNRWPAIVGSAMLFGLAHGAQNFPLFFDRFMFGLVCAWLVIRTGGLEAGIAMHVLNNFLAFGFALAFSDLAESLNVSEISWWNILVTLTQSLTYAALVVVVARRMGLQTRTRPPAGPPYTPATPVPAVIP
jgi:membrane protease YdiL (CAAX protease family)